MADEQLLRQRCVVREQFLRRTGRALVSLATAKIDELDGKAAPEAAGPGDLLASLQRELVLWRLGVRKQRAAVTASAQEQAEFQRVQQQTHQEMKEMQQEIASLHDKLAEARVHRQHEEEHDSLARLIDDLQSRSATERELEAVQSEIRELSSEQAEVQLRLDRRRKQSKLLLYALYEMQSQLSEEQAQDAGAAGAAKDASASGAGNGRPLNPTAEVFTPGAGRKRSRDLQDAEAGELIDDEPAAKRDKVAVTS